MLITILVVLGLLFLILGHEAGHFAAAKFFKMKVDEFGVGFPPKLFSRRKGETEYSVNLLPIGGFVRIAGENDRIAGNITELQKLPAEEQKKFFFAQPALNRSVVILAGVAANVLLGWLLFSGIYMIGTGSRVIVGGVEPGSPADLAGIKEGDLMLNFNNYREFIDYANSHRGQEVTLLTSQAGKERSVTLTPRLRTEEGQGAIGVMLAGVVREPFYAALWHGAQDTLYTITQTFKGLGHLLRNIVQYGSVPKDIVGPVGIFNIAQGAGQAGFVFLLNILGLISVNLAVLNLLPVPALDGGRFLMIIVEKIKGSPVSIKTEAWVNGLGMALLLLLMLAVTVRDIIN